MNRLTSNKHILDMNNYELAHNCCYVSGGNARYRNKFEDIDCRDFIRELMISYEVWKETNVEMTNDNIFDDTMTDYLQYTPAHVRGLISLLYRNMWAMAELRETLKQYEDAEQHGLLLNQPCKMGDDETGYSDIEVLRQENTDSIDKAVQGLDQFTKNWCMNVKETNKQDDLVFRCKECEFLHDEICLVKHFANLHKHNYDLTDFGCMGSH